MVDISNLNKEIGTVVRSEIDKKEADVINKSITAEDSFAPVISSMIAEIRNYTRADRVYIMEFHNGSRMMTGYHPRRMSITYENTSSEPIAKFFQGVPITLYWLFYDDLRNNEYMPYPDIEQIKEVRGIYLTFREFGVKSTYIYRICNITDGSVIGYVGIDYFNHYEMQEKEADYVQACMFRIRQAYNRIVIIMDLKI